MLYIHGHSVTNLCCIGYQPDFGKFDFVGRLKVPNNSLLEMNPFPSWSKPNFQLLQFLLWGFGIE